MKLQINQRKQEQITHRLAFSIRHNVCLPQAPLTMGKMNLNKKGMKTNIVLSKTQ